MGKVATSVFCLFVATHAQANINIQQELASTRCANQMQHLLASWRVEGPWTRTFGHLPGEKVFRAPTDSVGKWVELSLSEGVSHVHLYNEATILSVSFSPSCTEQAQLKAHPAPDRFGKQKYFGGYRVLRDRDMAQLIDADQPGVLFLWSPHMPISMKALMQMKRASDKTHVPLYAVVEPNSKPSAVDQFVQRLKLTKKQVFYLSSFDLQYRGMRLHLPSLIVFNRGKFTSQVRRGYEDEDVYEEYLRNHL